MKKLGLLLCLWGLSLSAQQEEIKFNQKLTYQTETNEENNGKRIFSFYLSDKQNQLLTVTNSGYLTLYNGKDFIPIIIDPFSKQVKVGDYSYYSEFPALERTEEKGSLNGRNCVIYKEKRKYEYKNPDKFCIDETSKANNASYFDNNVKGEVLFVQNEYGKMVLAEKKAVDYSIAIDKNEITAYYKEKQKQDSIMASYDNAMSDSMVVDTAASAIYEDPLIYHFNTKAYQKYFGADDAPAEVSMKPSIGVYAARLINSLPYYDYNEEERKKMVNYLKNAYKSYIKNLYKSELINKEEQKTLNKFFPEYITEVENYVPTPVSQNAIDTITHYTEDYDYFTPYQSVYKNEVIEKNPPLALNEVLNNEKLVKNMPQFCQNLGEKLPKFENEKLGLHLNNYLGQLCDLYLYQNGGSVGYFETINSMRKSLLEIELMQSTLSKKDKTQLTEIIKNLD